MKIGVCVGLDCEKAKVALNVGFDFVETKCSDVVKASQEELEAFKNVGIPVYAANCFIPYRVVDPVIEDAVIEDYLAKLYERSAYLGIKTLVFGSSGSRKALEGQTIEACTEAFAEFLAKRVLPYCEKYVIYLAIEPLRTAECNVVNTVPQAVEIAKKINSPYIRALADIKHMEDMKDPADALPAFKGWVIHGHTSNPYPEVGSKRVFPKKGDSFSQDVFMLPLKEAGVEYCSVEATLVDTEKDFAEAYEVLKAYR